MGARGRPPPSGLEKFQGKLCFQGKNKLLKILNNKKYLFNTVKNSRATLFFRAGARCSKILNVKSILNTVKNSTVSLFSRASASCSKILNNKKYIFRTMNSGHPLFFRACASFSKLLIVRSIFNTVNISGQLCFSGQAQVVQKS